MLKTRDFVRKDITQKGIPVMDGPLLVVVHFRIPIPSAISKKRKELLHLLPHTKKPDGDNLEKFLNDALNGIVWTDDSRITWLVRSKSNINQKEGETIVFVQELKHTRPDYEVLINAIREHIIIEGYELSN